MLKLSRTAKKPPNLDPIPDPISIPTPRWSQGPGGVVSQGRNTVANSGRQSLGTFCDCPPPSRGGNDESGENEDMDNVQATP